MHLIDAVHPNRKLAEEMSVVLKEWLDSRQRRIDLRDRIARRTEHERDDEQRQEEAQDIMVNGEDRRLVTGEDRESMGGDYEEAIEHLEREEKGCQKRASGERG